MEQRRIVQILHTLEAAAAHGVADALEAVEVACAPPEHGLFQPLELRPIHALARDALRLGKQLVEHKLRRFAVAGGDQQREALHMLKVAGEIGVDHALLIQSLIER